jgi:hypothetical protein
MLNPKFVLLISFLALMLSACGATFQPVIPTALPTITPTLTATITRTPGGAATLPPTPTRPTIEGMPSPTSIFGPTSTGVFPTATRPPDPNAPRIEFFTADVAIAAPGGSVRLFWSTRNADNAVIYRLDQRGQRSETFNVPLDGNLDVRIPSRERIEASFILSISAGGTRIEQTLRLPIACPDAWFFSPAPSECPAGPAETTALLEQPFERGRMVFVGVRERVYSLFNDGTAPAWISFQNLFNPERDPAQSDQFIPPPGLFQPIEILGFVWRGNDTVRNRLGLALDLQASYEGFVQTVTDANGAETLYISSSDSTVLVLTAGGDAWEIVTP